MKVEINKKNIISADTSIKMSKDETEYYNDLYKSLNVSPDEPTNRYMLWARHYPDKFRECVQKQILPEKLPGKIGNPLFRRGDIVGFFLKMSNDEDETFFKGKVDIVDAFGTFGQNEEPSYDVMVENFNNTGAPCLVKHIRESAILTFKPKTE